MLHWRRPRIPSGSPQEQADASEARALEAWVAAHRVQEEMRRAVSEAALVAEAVARLDQALRRLP